MDIIGTGLDATEISRIVEAIERYGDHFVRRVFTEGEIAYCRCQPLSSITCAIARSRECVSVTIERVPPSLAKRAAAPA